MAELRRGRAERYLFHRLEWRDVMLRAFGHRSRYYVVRDGGGTRGVLPLVEMKSSLFGRFRIPALAGLTGRSRGGARCPGIDLAAKMQIMSAGSLGCYLQAGS